MSSYKTIIIGDSNVGKSSLLNKFMTQEQNYNDGPTIGIDMKKKTYIINNNNIKFYIWDISGQNFYKNIVSTLYPNTNIVIITYDISNRKSFLNLGYWVNEIKNNLDISQISVYIIGNKTDLVREVEYQEGYNYGLINGFEFFETSTKDTIKVIKIFNYIITKKLNINNIPKERKSITFYSPNDPLLNKKKTNCCLIL